MEDKPYRLGWEAEDELVVIGPDGNDMSTEEIIEELNRLTHIRDMLTKQLKELPLLKTPYHIEYEEKVERVLRDHYLTCQKWSDTHGRIIVEQIAQDIGIDVNDWEKIREPTKQE